MVYKLVEEMEEFRESIRDFAEDKIRPLASYLDEAKEPATEIIDEMWEMGLFAIPFDEEYGGLGLTFSHLAAAIEEIAKYDSGLASILIAHTSLGAYPISEFGDEAQKEKFLKTLLDSKNLATFANNEEDDEINTKATDEGDYFLLNGKKTFVTNARLAKYYLVSALTNPSDKENGISLFILDKDMEGLSFSKTYEKLGSRSPIIGDLILKDVKVPKENLLGDLNKGNSYIEKITDGQNLASAALALGLGEASYEAAIDYSKNGLKSFKARKQAKINRPILAQMATNINASKIMVKNVAEKMDEKAYDFGKEAAMAKLFVGDLAESISSKALEICGGVSSTKGIDLERLNRDAKICQIYDGSSDLMKEIIAEYILDNKNKKKVEKKIKKDLPKIENRKKEVFVGDVKKSAKKLVEALVADGYKLKKDPVDLEGSVEAADRAVAIGMGFHDREDLDYAKDLAKLTGSVLASSRPAAQVRHLVPVEQFIGVSGKKFMGELYIGIGISGAIQHIKGIESAKKVVVINNDEGAQFFKDCDYGIVGDFKEVIPALIEEINNL